MARNPRVALPGYAYHLTQRGANRQNVFRTAGDRNIYLTLMQEHLKDSGVRLLSYCLMTNHVHFVVIPDRGDSLAVWMRRLTGRYAQYFNAKVNRSGPLWQSRFFSCALSPQHLTVALRYVEQNPVRAFMAAAPADHRWSSAKAHLTGELGPMLDEQEWLARGGSNGWAELLAETPGQPIVHLLKRCTYGGRPFGDEAFVAEVEGRLGCHWRRWPFEHELQDSEITHSLEALSPRICSAGA